MINQSAEHAEHTALTREMVAAPGWGARSWTGSKRFVRGKPLGAIGGSIVLLLALVALLAPIISPYDPRAVPAAPWEAPNSSYVLGADHVGRDVLSRLIYGARISLYVGLGSVLVGITASFVIGVALSYAGGVVDMVAQRIVDALMSLPGLLIALAIMAVVTPSLNTVILAIVIGMIAPVIRTVRLAGIITERAGLCHGGSGHWRPSQPHCVPAHCPQLLRHLSGAGDLLFGVCHHH